MGGKTWFDDLLSRDPGILSRAPCERPPQRSQINPWAGGMLPRPLSIREAYELFDGLGWIPHPPPPPPPQPTPVPTWPVWRQEFNLTTSKFVRPGTVKLGKNPNAFLPFTNAVEIVFHVDKDQVAGMKILDFRCKQEVNSEEDWQILPPSDQGGGNWVKVAATSSTVPDDPDPLNQVVALPVVCFLDTPGLVGFPSTKQFELTGKVLSDPRAFRLVVRQNFSAWVEGQSMLAGNKKDWRRISEPTQWHSNQGLTRNLSDQRWSSDGNTEIGLGHTSGPPTQ